MKIACLQIAAELGAVESNIARAERLVAGLPSDQKIDLLILPELAFSGYNFSSLEHISPFLEPTAAGISTRWAKTTAERLHCIVIVGYPEVVHESEDANGSDSASVRQHNSTVIVSPSGDIIGHYRKSFLYYTDETWASEGSGFYAGSLPCRDALFKPSDSGPSSVVDAGGASGRKEDLRIAAGICMDINPYKFEAPWEAYEFANHCLDVNADVVLLSNAWLSHTLRPEDLEEPSGMQPDLPTLSYWLERFSPIIKQCKKDVVVVVANRSGIEGGVTYAGTSCVLRLGHGNVELLNIAGKGEECLLISNTKQPAKWGLKLKPRPPQDETSERDASNQADVSASV